MHDLNDKKDALIAAAKRCFDLRLQTNAGGNLSVRLDSADAIVIKPSGIGFNECTRDNLQVVHLDGTIEPSRRPLPQPMGDGLCECGHRNPMPDSANHRKDRPHAPYSAVPARRAADGCGNQPCLPRPQGRRGRARQPRHNRCWVIFDQSAVLGRDHRRNSPYRLCARHGDGGPWQDGRRLAAIRHRSRSTGGRVDDKCS